MSTGLFSPLHIPIFLVPVGPIPRPVFDRLSAQLAALTTVTLDASGLPPPKIESKFTKTLLHPGGKVYLEFQREFRPDMAYLSELQLFRQAFAVCLLHAL